MSINAQPGRTIFTGENIATTGISYGGVNASDIMGQGSESNAATTGWIDSKYDHAVVQIGVATKAVSAGNIVFRIEGRYPGLSRPASILATVFSAVQTLDRVVNIVGKMTEIRVGVKTTAVLGTPFPSPTASPNNVYAGVVFSDIK